MPSNVILLGEVAAHLDMRPKTPVDTVMRALVGDCLQRNAEQERERCDPYAPELLEFFGKARPPE